MTGFNQKLDDNQVSLIKELLARGQKQADIAKSFYVTQPTISRIQNGTEWEHVPWPNGTFGGKMPLRKKQPNIPVIQERSVFDVESFEAIYKEQTIPEDINEGQSPPTTIPDTDRNNLSEQEERDIEELGKKAAERFERETLEQITTIDHTETKVEKKKKEKQQPKMVPWDYIVDLLGEDHGYVLAANEDELMQTAMQIVFHNLSETQWSGKKSLREVKKMMDNITNIMQKKGKVK